jgi:hypothetical protein
MRIRIKIRIRTGVGGGGGLGCGLWSTALESRATGGGGGEVLGEVEEDSAREKRVGFAADEDGVGLEVVVVGEEVVFGVGVALDGGVAGEDDAAGVVGELEAAASCEDGFHCAQARFDLGPGEPEREGFDAGVGFARDVAEGERGAGDVGDDLGGDVLGGIEPPRGLWDGVD